MSHTAAIHPSMSHAAHMKESCHAHHQLHLPGAMQPSPLGCDSQGCVYWHAIDASGKVFIRKRALCICKRALCICKRAPLLTHKDACIGTQSMLLARCVRQKSPVYPQKSHVYLQKSPVIDSQGRVYCHANDTSDNVCACKCVCAA